MAAVRKSKKKKIIIIVCILLALAGIAAGITAYAIDQSILHVELYTVGTSDIYETVDATGTVSAGTVREYKVDSVATVKEVFVEAGDEVKKGDLLASFDTSTFDEQIKKLQDSYNETKTSYNEAIASQKSAKASISRLDKQITALQKEIASLELSVPKGGKDVQSNVVEAYNKALSNINQVIETLSDDDVTKSELVSIVMRTIASQVENGVTSPNDIANAVADAINKAVADGTIDETKLKVSLKDAVAKLQEVIKAQNWNTDKNFSDSLTQYQTDAAKLAYDQVILNAYTAEKQFYSSLASDSLVKSRKNTMDTAKDALETLKESKQKLSVGWVADFDGVITDCSITPGRQTSLISSGITLQNLNKMTVTVSLGEYDIHKVNVGMPVTITTAYGTYTGSVISKAPVASGGSDSSIIDSVGSMMGISGMSSLTQKGSGVEVKISVDNPDENIIVGFDAGVEISVGEHKGVVTVPTESMIHDKMGTYVYLYNEEDGTVTKTKIKTGAMSYTEYEIVGGLKQGDRIIYAPMSTYEDSFEVKVSN